jgi:hypothetical protein
MMIAAAMLAYELPRVVITMRRLTKLDSGQQCNNQPTNGGVAVAAAAVKQRKVSGSLAAAAHSAWQHLGSCDG